MPLLYIPPRGPRLPGFDYSSDGAYFVTLVTHQREELLGSIEDEALRPTPLGALIEELIPTIPQHHPGASLDAWIVMPNHVHVIIWLLPTAPNVTRTRLGVVFGGFKSASTRLARQRGVLPNQANLWQSGYHDQIIRDEGHLNRAREYVLRNPEMWSRDRLHR